MALHALVAMDLPGPGTGFLSQPWRFPAPVYIGDTITAEAEVLGAARHETGDAPQGPRAAADGGGGAGRGGMVLHRWARSARGTGLARSVAREDRVEGIRS